MLTKEIPTDFFPRKPGQILFPSQSVLKGINPECSLEGLMLKLKLQYFGHLMWKVDSLEKTAMLGKMEGKRRMGWQRMRWLYSIIESMDVNLSKLQETEEDRGTFCSPWGRKESDTTEWAIATRDDKWKWTKLHQLFLVSILVSLLFTSRCYPQCQVAATLKTLHCFVIQAAGQPASGALLCSPSLWQRASRVACWQSRVSHRSYTCHILFTTH